MTTNFICKYLLETSRLTHLKRFNLKKKVLYRLWMHSSTQKHLLRVSILCSHYLYASSLLFCYNKTHTEDDDVTPLIPNPENKEKNVINSKGEHIKVCRESKCINWEYKGKD